MPVGFSKKKIKVSVIKRLHIISQVLAQLPPRLNIPGAVLVNQGRARPRIQQSLDAQPIRIRRPIANAAPVRPVVEEPEDSPEQEISSAFDDEVARLGISSLQTAVSQAVSEEELEQPKPLQFRPERPVPVLRQDLRESPKPRPAPIGGARPAPIGGARPAPLFRDNLVNVRPAPVKSEYRDDPVPIRRPVQRPIVQEFRQPARNNPPPQRAQQVQYEDDEDERKTYRNRKPPVQILRKYRTDNEDGSITWGYENDDGTFKEETIGIDCITRGKYGYTDPDGVRREYTYETGGRCEDPEEELPPEPPTQLVQVSQKGGKKIYRLPA